MARDYYTPPGSVPNDIDSRDGLKSTWCCFDKGYTPPPFKLIQDEETGIIEVVFEKTEFTSTCKCRIVCTTDALVFEDSISPNEIGQFCPADTSFKATLVDQIFNTEEPTFLSFLFQDVHGNESTVEVNSLLTVIPRTPLVITKTYDSQSVHEVAVPLYSHSFFDLRDIVDQYQVERYEGSPANRQIWVDWTHTRGYGTRERVHWDRAVRPGITYGYRVRFRTAFDNASAWSEWRTIAA